MMIESNSAVQWQAGVGAVLTMFLAIAVIVDSRQRRIPNVLVLVMLSFGLVLNALGPQSGDGGLFSSEPGASGIWRALGGALTGLLLFLPLYLLRVLGAGDVKLMTAVGGFAGPAATANLALFVLLAGGLLAVARMLFAGNMHLVLRNTFGALSQLRPGSSQTFDARTQTAWRMPYAVAIAGGVAAYAWWTLSGHSPILNF